MRCRPAGTAARPRSVSIYLHTSLGKAMSDMEKSRKCGMRGRVIASLFMLLSFCLLVPSGILLHVFSPDGFDTRVHVLMTVHNVCALVFVVSGVAHLVFNRKSMLSYLRRKYNEYRIPGRELVLVLIVFTLLLTAALLHICLLG
jgi:hypothetical protein